MARRYQLICALGFLVYGNPMFAQQTQSGEAPDQTRPGNRRAIRNAAPNSPEFDEVRRAIDALTPEQRRRFQENFVRWINLSPEDKRALRDRDEQRRKRIHQETERALRETGLQLDPERRELFAKRYAEERRKVEEQLRRETEEKRQPRLREIVGKLKNEFSEPASAASQATNLAAPTAPAAVQ